MIKWDGFGKLLRQGFFILLISCFIFLGSSFVNATLQIVGIDSQPSSINNQYDLTFLKWGGLITNYLGTSKNLLALDSNKLFWWAENGQPYFYSPERQGFFGQFFSCDELTQSNGKPTNCSSLDMTGDYKTILRNFFLKIYAGDLVYYNYYNSQGGVNCSYDYKNINVCFSSQEVGKSLCFKRASCYNGCMNGSSACQSFCNDEGGCGGSLVNSQGLTNTTFASIPLAWLYPSPGQNGYNGDYSLDGSVSVDVSSDNYLTGDFVYSECTVGQVKSKLERFGMSPNICYSGLPLSGSQFAIATPGTGATVFQIYNSTKESGQSFQSWLSYWLNIYNHRYVYDNSVWSGNVAGLFTYFKFLTEYFPEVSSDYYQDLNYYCKIIIENPNLTKKWSGPASYCPLVSGPGIDSTVLESGNTAIGTNWDGVGNLGSGKTYTDGIVFIQDFFNNLKSRLNTSDYGSFFGFLPGYIIWFLLAIILFRFISH